MIRSATNGLRPVNRLPPDILVKVLRARESERDLVAATHVCAQWRAILTSTPTLWTKISCGNISRMRCYLKRSGQALIDVTIGKSAWGPADVLHGATPWVSRMKSLCILTDKDQIRAAVKLLCQETPHLKSLKIKATHAPYSTSRFRRLGGAFYIPPDFLGNHAPSLESIIFHSVSPGVVLTFPMPKLTHIDWVAETVLVSIEELLDLFVSSQLLEVIRVHVRIRRTRGLLEPLRKVTLNRLRELDWADLNGSISLVPCLTAPELSRLKLKIARSPQNQPATLSSILFPNGSYIPLPLEPTVVEYSCNQRGDRSCSFGYLECATHISVSEYPKDDSADSAISPWFSSDLPISFYRTEELTVRATGVKAPLPSADLPIEQFEKVNELHLEGTVDLLAKMIEVNRGEPIPCPALSKVVVSTEDQGSTLRELGRVLKERKEAGCGVRTVQLLGLDRYRAVEIEELREQVDEVTAGFELMGRFHCY